MSEQPLSLEEAAARIKVKAPSAPVVQPQAETPILEVKDLNTWFPIKKGIFARTAGYVKAVNGVSFSMKAGETLGVVGESG